MAEKVLKWSKISVKKVIKLQCIYVSLFHKLLCVIIMSGKNDFEMLKDEKINASLNPHPLSFLKYYAADLHLIFLAIALHQLYAYINSNPEILGLTNMLFGLTPWVEPKNLFLFIVYWAVLVLSGLIVSVLWVNKMPLLYMVLVATAGTLIEVCSPIPNYLTIIPKPFIKIWFLIPLAIIGFFLVEAYRKGHKYFLTNYRIITIKKFISKEIREIMYDKIADIYIAQGLLGRLFNYGTIIPISESNLGLGENAALASVSVAAPIKKGFLGISFSGKKGVSMPRAATYLSLYGIPNPRKICGIIGERQLEMKETPTLKRIENLLRKGKEKEKEKLGEK